MRIAMQKPRLHRNLANDYSFTAVKNTRVRRAITIDRKLDILLDEPQQNAS